MKMRQKGLTTVEFAIIGALFFIVLFGVIEFGRMLFVWNTLTEATRRGARVAAVCPVNHPAIARKTVFNDENTDGSSPILSNLSTDDVEVQYLEDDGDVIADPVANFSDIAYVRVSISGGSDGVAGYQHDLLVLPALIPGLTGTLTAPEFETTLPRESLGVVPGIAEPQCPFS